MKKTYPILIEKTGTGYCATVPDLPGCVAAGKTIDETKELMESTLLSYIEDMIIDGEKLPEPGSTNFQDELDENCEVHYVEIEVQIKVNAA
jgi:predicted RNase H-like HicB family nuclease